MKTYGNVDKYGSTLIALAQFLKSKPWFDTAVVLVMSLLLFYGASWQIFRDYTDVAKYQCYALAFWEGVSALHQLPIHQCTFITTYHYQAPSLQVIVNLLQHIGFPAFLLHFFAAQNSNAPFGALPHEYPWPVLLPFSLPLIVPAYWYQVAFAVLMALVAIFIYYVLLRTRSRRAALLYAFYLVIGTWGTAEGRFDLIPSALTLLALVYAVRKRWHWAFAYLALGTMFKFYPAVLLMPFLLTQQMESREPRFSWRRLLPLGTFVVICALIMLVSLLFSIQGTLEPFSYFGGRPIQVESASATLLWLFSFVGFKLTAVFNFGSLNILSILSPAVSILGILALLLGLGYTYWLQWRGKLPLATACLLTLLIIIFTGKVFSPQYLIWIVPLVAYVCPSDRKLLISWTAICAVTTFIYPYIYNMASLLQLPSVPLFFPVIALRNVLLFYFIVVLLHSRSRQTSAYGSFVTAKKADMEAGHATSVSPIPDSPTHVSGF